MTTNITELAHGLLDFTQPLETESGEPVTYVCHDVIEYKCARVCVDVETGIVYSSPHVGLKIRNVRKYASVRKFTEEAAQAYHEHEQGWISDMKCGDRSHEYLSFVRDPKNILALVEDLESEKRICATWRKTAESTSEKLEKAQQRIAELEDAEQKLCAANVTLDARAELAERQLAELDSRTVTVKLASRRLPSDYVDGEFGNDDLAAIHNACLLECKVSVEKYLSAHGIVVKWEAE